MLRDLLSGPWMWVVIFAAITFGARLLNRVLPLAVARVLGWVVFLALGAVGLAIAAWGLYALPSAGATAWLLIIGLYVAVGIALSLFGYFLKRVIAG